MLTTIFFGLLALFLIIKLKSLLGKEDIDSEVDKKTVKLVENIDRKVDQPDEDPFFFRRNDDNLINEDTKKIFDSMSLNSNITPRKFIVASLKILENIVEKYSNNNIEDLSSMVSGNIIEKLKKSLKKNQEEKESEKLLLIKIIDAKIIDAKTEGNKGHVYVRIESEQINYTLNTENNNVIKGSKTELQLIKETFLFSKEIEGQGSWMLENILT